MTSWPQEKEKNTLPKTSSLLLIIGRNPEGKDESPNHQFSRGNSLLVSGRVRCSIGNTSTCKTCPVPSFFRQLDLVGLRVVSGWWKIGSNRWNFQVHSRYLQDLFFWKRSFKNCFFPCPSRKKVGPLPSNCRRRTVVLLQFLSQAFPRSQCHVKTRKK